MALNDILEARIVILAGTQVSLNIRHYRIADVVAPEPSRLNCATTLDALFVPLYRALLCSAATYRGVGVRRLLPAPRTTEDVSTGNAAAGAGGPDLLPKQTTGLISLRTAEATRKGRGRVYIAFPAETDNTAAGAPTVPYTNLLVTLAAQFVATVPVVAGGGSLNLLPVIFRRADGTFRFVTNSIARVSWATQRRRGDLGRSNLSPF